MASKKYFPGKYFTGEPCKNGHIAERLRYNGQCIECKKITDRGSNIKASRKYSLASNYNLTEDQVQEMHFNQKGLCWICENPLKPKQGTQIDHCHKSGKIRGLLCNHCNRLLGSAKDSIVILRNAIRYLEKNK